MTPAGRPGSRVQRRLGGELDGQPTRKPAGAAEVIASVLTRHAGLDLPVRLRAWDGSEAGPPGPPVLVARSPRSLRRILWRPGELGLARAYISGDLDVEGDLTEGLRRGWRTIRPDEPPRPAARAIPSAAWIPAAWTAARAAARLKVLGPPWRPPTPPGCELRVTGRRHSLARDRAVIADHSEGTVNGDRDRRVHA
jgi:cyclopropane-fatty-acyl-phospholipid synthase